MSHGHSHAEEAEHHSHHALDPFDKRVALTMVVIAAVLAGVKVVGHRAHNNTLSLQIGAAQKQSQSGVAHTKESDIWNLFQAQKIREHQYKTQARALAVTAREAKYGPEAQKEIEDLQKRAKGYLEEATDWKKKAEALQSEGLKLQKEGIELQKDSEHMHHLCDYFDLGEMAVEIGLVLCSLAILVKMRFFWLFGIVVALIGVAITGVGLLPAKHDKDHDSHSARVVEVRRA